MKILAIDTATLSCSVALVNGKELLAETTLVNDQTHSKHVMLLIRQVLDMSGVSVNELDGFAATHGPGTFTGLRIGMSTLKGMADAADKPIVGVSSLAALACQGDSSIRICALIDARRSEVYWAQYHYEKDQLKALTTETVGPLQQAIRDIETPCCFIGSGAVLYKDDIRKHMGRKARFVPAYKNTIRAATVAYLGSTRLADYDSDRERDRFLPVYLRLSDAEMNLARQDNS